MQISSAVLLLLMGSVIGQTPTKTTLRVCYTKPAASRFCANADGTSTVLPATQPASGYCCDDASTEPECTDGSDYHCTLNNKGEMSKPLWSTYWPGITPEICGGGSNQLTATTELQTITSFSL